MKRCLPNELKGVTQSTASRKTVFTSWGLSPFPLKDPRFSQESRSITDPAHRLDRAGNTHMANRMPVTRRANKRVVFHGILKHTAEYCATPFL